MKRTTESSSGEPHYVQRARTRLGITWTAEHTDEVERQIAGGESDYVRHDADGCETHIVRIAGQRVSVVWSHEFGLKTVWRPSQADWRRVKLHRKKLAEQRAKTKYRDKKWRA